MTRQCDQPGYADFGGESDNPAVAYVTDGAVTPETSGTVTITARSADREEVLDSVTLTVYTIPVEIISITGRPEDDNLPDGESVQLAVTILPENVTDGVNFWQRNTQWSSSDPSVASVDSNGLVTAHSLGTAVITAEVLYYGVSGSFTLTVPRVPVTNIYLANSNGQESITEGSSLYICPVVRPENATNQTLLWVSDNPTVATASATNCTIYAHAPGNATITLMAESDPTVTAEIEVTVFPMTVELNRPSGDTLIKGQSWQLATNPNVRISSRNSDIVTVGENGWITANKTGRVILEVWWAHDPGGFMRYELVVSTGLTIIGRPENDTLYTQVTYTDIGAAYSADQYYEVLWDSSDPSVAEIEYNFVRGTTTITTHSPGTTYISALIPELNAYDIFELTVIQCQLDNILFDPDSALEDNQLYVGEKGELSAEIFPAAFADQPLQWTSTEPEILQVMPITYTRAKVVAKAPGYAIVSVKHNGIPYNNFEVTVKSPTIQIVNLPSANRLKVGQTHTLTAMTDPAGMTVTWKSGNTNVATVNSAGKITAKAAGTATISATVVRGGKSYTASFTLKVGEPVTGVWIDCPLTNYVIWAGSSCVLTAEVLPNNAYDKSVIWSSDDTSVATVSSNGILSAKKAGMTVIRAKSQADPSIGDYFVVEVRSSAITNLSINTPINGSLSDSIKEKWYSFTPTISDVYSFYSTGSIDIMGSLYQGKQTLLESDDNSGLNNNFCIERGLASGITYYLKVYGHSTSISGNYSICVLPSSYGAFSATATDYPINIERLNKMQQSEDEYNNWPASAESRYYGYTLEDRREALEKIRERALLTCDGGDILNMPDAANALRCFLVGPGADYIINVGRLCEESSKVGELRKEMVNQLLLSSEKIVPVGITKTIYNTQIFNCVINDNSNWHNTLHSCECRIKATVTRSSNSSFTATVKFGVIDFYDWEKTDTSMGNKPVSPRDLWELHHGGFAKNFRCIGDCTLTVCWNVGQRWDSGASISI